MAEVDRTPSAACVCGEINTRHCPVHGQGETTAATTQEDVAFLAAMLELVPKGHATASEYERLERLAEPYLAARFQESEGGAG